MFFFKKTIFLGLILMITYHTSPDIAFGSQKKIQGPLSIHQSNPRYFSDSTGDIIYLTGSHTWNNFQDIKSEGLDSFDFAAYLDFMQENNHNFMRLWVWEQAAWISTVEGKPEFDPTPYQRTGPGKAIDGGMKFDLTLFNQDYFDRLRSRVLAAKNRGIYVAVMLFQGFSVETKPYSLSPVHPVTAFLRNHFGGLGFLSSFIQPNNPWKGHPFNGSNNVNGINGDPERTSSGHLVHTLELPAITKLQEEYVKKVIDTLYDLDNIIWEISNESHADSTAWQYHMVNFIRNYEKERGQRHPVLMTAQWPNGDNDVLFESSAEAVSPNQEGGYRDNPPAADGSKVIIVDTDHLWGIGGDWQWVWKSFLMGMNPIFMDPYDFVALQDDLDISELELIRKNMGYTRAFSDKVNLAAMVPRPDLASSGFCLADVGREYLVYVPEGETVSVKINDVNVGYEMEWFDPVTGATKTVGPVSGETLKLFLSPFANAGVLYLHEREIL